jgi:hypothetical protein
MRYDGPEYLNIKVLHESLAPSPHGAIALRGPVFPRYRSFTITLRHTTFGILPLDELPARPVPDNKQQS